VFNIIFVKKKILESSYKS